MLRRLLACALMGLVLTAALVGVLALSSSPDAPGRASIAVADDPPPPDPDPDPDPDPEPEPEPEPDPTCGVGSLPSCLPSAPPPTATPTVEPSTEPTAAPTTRPTPRATPTPSRAPEPVRTRGTRTRTNSVPGDDLAPEAPRGFAPEGTIPKASARPIAIGSTEPDDPLMKGAQTGVAIALVLGIGGIAGLYLTRQQP